MADIAAQPTPHLLVVDDEADVRALLQRYFSGQGFRVSCAESGAAMRAVQNADPADLVLLDLGLPGEDGLELTRYLRSHCRCGVIIVTGRGDSIDRVVGLELGADDYVTKPFELRELLARVRSVLRRAAPPRQETPPAGADVVAFADFRLDRAARRLTAADGRDIVLTTGEFDLLCVFLDQPHRVLSRDTLMDRLHGREAGAFDRAVDVQVGRLRRKIEQDAAAPELIKSVRGAGYLFTPQVRKL
jgi:DNA-binding response OmpR family regulator